MKEKIKKIIATGLFYISLFLVVLFFMIILEPKCVGHSLRSRLCMTEEAYYLVFTPAIYIVFVSIIKFIRDRLSK